MVGVLAMAGVAVVAAILVFRHKPPPAGPEVASSQVAPTVPALDSPPSAPQVIPKPTRPEPSTTAPAQAHPASAQVATNPQESLKELIKSLKDPSLSLTERKKAIKALAQ